MNRINIVLLIGITITTILAPGAFAQTRDVQKVPNQSKLQVQPLNVKPGLWETTTTFKRSGAPPISPETLARFTAEQRARLEQRMNANSGGSTNTVTDQHCVTKEDVEKADFGQGKGECTYSIETSTSTQGKGSYSCDVEGMKVKWGLGNHCSGSITYKRYKPWQPQRWGPDDECRIDLYLEVSECQLWEREIVELNMSQKNRKWFRQNKANWGVYSQQYAPIRLRCTAVKILQNSPCTNQSCPALVSLFKENA